jgi:hypothetical protein
MNPKSPTDTLSSDETARLRTLVQIRGEKEAMAAVGLRTPLTFLRAMHGLPVARLTVEVIRGRLAGSNRI